MDPLGKMIIQTKCESVDVMVKGQSQDLFSCQKIKVLITLVIKLPMSWVKALSNNKVLPLSKHIIHYHFTHMANNANHVISNHTCYQYITSNQFEYDNNGRDH